MTDEQEKQIAEINGLLSDPWRHDTGHFINGCETLMDIIDDLQKQQPKRYTEAELREAFNGWFAHPSFIRIDNFKQWIECARFLGMIKTEVEL